MAVATHTSALRILHVEDDPIQAHLMQVLLRAVADQDCQIAQSTSLGEASRTLSEQEFDVVLLDLSLPDSTGLDTLAQIRQCAGRAAIVVVSASDDERLAHESLRRGAQAYIAKSRLDAATVRHEIERAIARRRQPPAPPFRGLSDHAAAMFLPEMGDAAVHSGFISATERAGQAELEQSPSRRHPRYHLTRPAVVVPVLSGGAPDLRGMLEGASIDISRRGVGIMTGHGKAPANDVVIGMEADDGTMHFASANVRHVRPTETGWTIGAEFVEPSQDLLRPANLALRLDPATFQFKAVLRVEHLQQWAVAGVLRPRLVDWVQLCPHCEALPTFRYGCPACGSAHIVTSQLIHHYACAHVAAAVDFEQGDSIVCPKCRARNLVVGADFEYSTGPYRCLDCGWTDGELMHIAQCLRCQFRFPAVDAIERELIEFYVHRLDPLALVAND